MTPEEINALPTRVRDYIRDLATRCDPAGDVQRIAELQDQVNQLTALASWNTGWMEFIQLWLKADRTREHGTVGISSKALLEFAVGGGRPSPDRWPSDPADLERCFLTWGLLPYTGRERARSLILAFRDQVERRYPVERRPLEGLHDLPHLPPEDLEGPPPREGGWVGPQGTGGS